MFWLILSAAIGGGLAWWAANSLRKGPSAGVSRPLQETTGSTSKTRVKSAPAPLAPNRQKPRKAGPVQTARSGRQPDKTTSKPEQTPKDPPGELSEGSCWQMLLNTLPLKYGGGNPGTSKPWEIVKFYVRKHCWKTHRGMKEALRFADRVCRTSGTQNRLIANLLLDMEKIDRDAYMNGVFDEVRAIRGRLVRLLPQALMDQRRGRSIEGYELQAKRIIENALKTYPPEIFYGLYAAGSHPDGAVMLDLLVQWLNKYSGWKYSKDEVAIKDWKATRLWTVPLKKWAEGNYKKLPCVNR